MEKILSFNYSHFGVNDCECQFHLVPFKETLATWEHSFKLVSGMGMHWDRVHLPGVFSWNIIEKEKGRYDWKYSDALVTLAQKYNIHLLPNIWPFAWWDQKSWEGKGFPLIETQHMDGEDFLCDKNYPFPPRYNSPHDWNAYLKWITALVERYDGDGIDDMPGLKYPIKYWEIENEVGAMMWGLPPFPTKPEDYSRLLKESYVVAKKADPECKILIEGWAYHENEPFFRDAIELGRREGRQYFDIINLHVYTVEDTINEVLKTKSLLTEYGLKMPIWITEWSASGVNERWMIQFSGMGRPLRFRFRKLPDYPKERPEDLQSNPLRLKRDRMSGEPMPYSEIVEARRVIIGLTLSFWNGVEKIFWATLGQRIKPPDFKSSSPLPPLENVFTHTIMKKDGSLKLMYYSIGLFMDKLDKFKAVRKIKLSHDVNAFIYDIGPEWNPSIKQIVVIWSDEKKEVILEGLTIDKVLITSLIPEVDEEEKPIIKEGKPIFREELKKVEKGVLEITVDEDPVMVEIN